MAQLEPLAPGEHRRLLRDHVFHRPLGVAKLAHQSVGKVTRDRLAKSRARVRAAAVNEKRVEKNRVARVHVAHLNLALRSRLGEVEALDPVVRSVDAAGEGEVEPQGGEG